MRYILYSVLGSAAAAVAFFGGGMPHTEAAHAKSGPVQAKLDLDAKIGASYSLENATFDEAIKAMKDLPGCKDLNFTVSSPKSSDRRVTFQLGGDTTVKDLIDQISSLYGRSYRVEKGIVRFTNQPSFISGITSDADGAFTFVTPDGAKVQEELKALSPEVWAMQGGTETTKELQRIAQELRKAAKEFDAKDSDKFTKDIQEHAAELERLAKELAKEKGAVKFDYIVPRLKEFKGLLPEGFKLDIPSGESFRLFERDGKKFSPEKQREMEKWLREHGYRGKGKTFELPSVISPGDMEKLGKAYNFSWGGSSDIDGLMKSITKEQWAQHKKQGYLKYDQLTAEQQQMLGMRRPEGKFSLNYSYDGKSLSIRGE